MGDFSYFWSYFSEHLRVTYFIVGDSGPFIRFVNDNRFVKNVNRQE